MTIATHTGAKNKCYAKHYREKECVHWLDSCNLCLEEHTFCERHGCKNCGLKARDCSPEMIAMPYAERQILIAVTKREKPEERQIRRKKRTTPKKRNHREAWLDDLVATR